MLKDHSSPLMYFVNWSWSSQRWDSLTIPSGDPAFHNILFIIFHQPFHCQIPSVSAEELLAYSHPRASAKNFSGGPMKNQDREIAPISLPQLYQWGVRERNGHTPKSAPQGKVASRA